MSEIKAIETYYKGYRFRSRLEARWAVFFDTAKIKWEYEPEGFNAKDGTKYLPDFYLPEYDAYVEVNPPGDGIAAELEKAISCIDNNPGAIRVLAILSNIPEDDEINIFWFSVLYKHPLSQDITRSRFAFLPTGECEGLYPDFNYFVGRRYDNIVYWQPANAQSKAVDLVSPVADKSMPYSEYEINNHFMVSNWYDYPEVKNVLKKCFDAARQARFEHGERG